MLSASDPFDPTVGDVGAPQGNPSNPVEINALNFDGLPPGDLMKAIMMFTLETMEEGFEIYHLE